MDSGGRMCYVRRRLRGQGSGCQRGEWCMSDGCVVGGLRLSRGGEGV